MEFATTASFPTAERARAKIGEWQKRKTRPDVDPFGLIVVPNVLVEFCPSCEIQTEFVWRPETATYVVNDRTVPVRLPARVCVECGERLIDEWYGDPSVMVQVEYRRLIACDKQREARRT